MLLDSTNAIAYEPSPARPPPAAETLERMLQAATYGAQVLDAATKRVLAEPPRPPADRSSDDGDGDANRGRQVSDIVACLRYARIRLTARSIAPPSTSMPCHDPTVTICSHRSNSRERIKVRLKDRRVSDALPRLRQNGGAAQWVRLSSLSSLSSCSPR